MFVGPNVEAHLRPDLCEGFRQEVGASHPQFEGSERVLDGLPPDAHSEHRMGRNFLKGAEGDAANAVLAAAGYNFRRLLAWLAILWRVFVTALLADASGVAFPSIADA